MFGSALPYQIPAAEWIPAPPNPNLGDEAPDLWRVDLDRQKHAIHELATVLNEDEREKAEKFKLIDDRRRFVVRRAALRLLLDRYRCGQSTAIRFSYSSRGKPALCGLDSDTAVRFNTSYRDDFAILAFSTAGEIGVDLERIRDFPYLDEVAATFMAAEELRVFRGDFVSSRQDYFYLCWTVKEAVLKMTGEGLTTNPRQLKIHPEQGGIVSVTGLSAGSGKALVRAFQPFPGFLAAVAAATPLRKMNFFTFPKG